MGKVYKFGDNIDTDVIIPGKYLSISVPGELAKFCMEGYDPALATKLRPGDIFVGGNNFGCGSSREQAPVAIHAAGISCVIAKSFARIFYRNSINIGMPVLESEQAVDDIDEGDDIVVDLTEGIITNNSKNKTYNFTPFPPNLRAIINAGGLESYYRQKQK